MLRNDSVIRFYVGGFGTEPKYPSIAISVSGTDELKILTEAISMLSEGRHEQAAINRSSGISLIDMEYIRFQSVPLKGWTLREKRLLWENPKETDCARFLWKMPREDWGELLKVVKNIRHASHEYLTTAGFDDALVTVFCGEGMNLEK